MFSYIIIISIILLFLVSIFLTVRRLKRLNSIAERLKKREKIVLKSQDKFINLFNLMETTINNFEKSTRRINIRKEVNKLKKLIFILLIILSIATISSIVSAEVKSGSCNSMSLYYRLIWPWQSVWVFVDDMREEDVDSIPNAKYSKVGDTYVGPSGAIYKLEPIAVEERDMLEATGLMIIGSWELQKKDEKSKEKQEREEMKK